MLVVIGIKLFVCFFEFNEIFILGENVFWCILCFLCLCVCVCLFLVEFSFRIMLDREKEGGSEREREVGLLFVLFFLFGDLFYGRFFILLRLYFFDLY